MSGNGEIFKLKKRECQGGCGRVEEGNCHWVCEKCKKRNQSIRAIRTIRVSGMIRESEGNFDLRKFEGNNLESGNYD